jgi:hypothetical protein
VEALALGSKLSVEAVFVPVKHVPAGVVPLGDWYTWSESFRDFVRRLIPDLRRLGDPPLVEIPGADDYNWSFSFSPSVLSSEGMRRELRAFAGMLQVFSVPRGLVLLDDLLDEQFDTREIQALFALLRGALVEQASDPWAALYTPLGESGPKAGAFALHSDLYAPEVLINVFDCVPADDSGASLFFPVAELSEVLLSVKSLRRTERARILEIFREDSRADRFDELFDLLHGSHPWKRELERALASRLTRVRLGRGQGYLLQDRQWLHGRDAPTGGVPEHRVHRLAFCSKRNGRRGAEA